MSADPVVQQNAGPNIAESFIADRQTFFTRFTSFTTTVVVILAVGLILMAIFLT